MYIYIYYYFFIRGMILNDDKENYRTTLPVYNKRELYQPA